MSLPKSISTSFSKKSFSFFWLLLFLLLAFSALCFYKTSGATYSIFKRTWGFDLISFYGTNAKLLFFFLCFVLILPYTNNLIKIAILWLIDKFSVLTRKKIVLFLFLSLLSVFIFYFFTVKYYFLGDFNIRMIQTMKKEFVATEYVTMRLLYTFTSLGMKCGFPQVQIFKAYSYLAGGCFVFFALLIADLLGKNSLQKILFFFAQVSSALMLVFCGYVEVYATPVMMLIIYYYFGLRYLKYNKGFLFAILSLAFAIACHVLCLAALPSLFLAWYFHNKTKLPFITRLSNLKIAGILIILIILSLVVALKAKSGFLLTLSPPVNQPKTMTLFAFRHFWEVINGMLLSCGLSFIFIFILLIKSIREKKQLLAEHYFLIAASGCFFLLIFMANLQRGSGDWDIMTFPAVSLNLLTAVLITHLYKSQIEVIYYLLIALVGLNGTHSFLWLQINHTDRSIAKIEKMLVGDPANYYVSRITSRVQLALTYKNNNLFYYAEQAAKEACNTGSTDDLRACVMYAVYLQDNKKKEEARAFFEELLSTRSAYIYEAYLFLLQYYENSTDKIKFDYYLNLLFDTFYQDPMPYVNNVNFQPKIMTTIFEVLYARTPQENTKRRQNIRTVIDRISAYKPGGKF